MVTKILGRRNSWAFSRMYFLERCQAAVHYVDEDDSTFNRDIATVPNLRLQGVWVFGGGQRQDRRRFVTKPMLGFYEARGSSIIVCKQFSVSRRKVFSDRIFSVYDTANEIPLPPIARSQPGGSRDSDTLRQVYFSAYIISNRAPCVHCVFPKI